MQLREVAPSSELINIKIPDVSARVNYQIIDIYTSETKFHQIASVNLSQADFVELGQAVNKTNIRSLSAEIISSQIAESILDAIYPAVLTSISEDNQVSLNFGANFFKIGDQFKIFRRGTRSTIRTLKR